MDAYLSWTFTENVLGSQPFQVINCEQLYQARCAQPDIYNYYNYKTPKGTKSFAQDTKYVYVTTSTEYLAKRANAAKDPAFIIDGEALTILMNSSLYLDSLHLRSNEQ